MMQLPWLLLFLKYGNYIIIKHYKILAFLLQNSVHTNAALGSNLSLAGTVECDASIMDGQGNFGAVGAVGG